MDWKKVFKELVDQPDLHARFLNTLSLMEYIGARKIVKSQHEKFIDREVLAHMTEEIRHAQIFKKLAMKLSGGELKTYADEYLLAGEPGRNYLQIVDRAVESVIGEGKSWKNYLLSTLLIEERANKVYPYYEELLKAIGHGGYVKAILREEEHHLEQIEQQLKEESPLSDADLAALRKIEEQAFFEIIAEIGNENASRRNQPIGEKVRELHSCQ